MAETFQLHSFEEARLWLPEEVKCNKQQEIQRYRERLTELIRTKQNIQNIDEVNAIGREIYILERKLEAMGGDTRERLEKVLNVYNPETDSKWFIDGFGEYERKLFHGIIFGNDPKRPESRGLLERFRGPDGMPLSVTDLVVDDRGMGTGRSLRMVMDVVRDERGLREAQMFAKNLHGIDLMPKNIDLAYQLFRDGRYGFPDGNISVGNYLDPSSKRSDAFSQKKAHLVICMMHSVFYNTTEEQMSRFFENVREDLLPGGLFVFDTVGIPHFNPAADGEQIEKLSTFDDIRDIYTCLWMKYCRLNQRHMHEGMELARMPRFPIYDNTSGQGFYWREVPTTAYINHIFKQIGGGLKIVDARTRTPQYYTKEEAQKYGQRMARKNAYERAIRHGRKWISENGFEEPFLAEISRRLDRGIVNPYDDILNRTTNKPINRSKGKTKGKQLEELLLDDIAGSMAGDHYSEVYMMIERV